MCAPARKREHGCSSTDASLAFTCWLKIYPATAAVVIVQRMLFHKFSFAYSYDIRVEQTKRETNFSFRRRANIKLRFIFGVFRAIVPFIIFTCTRWTSAVRSAKKPNIFWRFIQTRFPWKTRFCGDNEIYVRNRNDSSYHSRCGKRLTLPRPHHAVGTKCGYRIFTFETIPICGLTVLSQQHWTFDMIPGNGSTTVSCAMEMLGSQCHVNLSSSGT